MLLTTLLNAVTNAINNLQLPAGPRGERGPPGEPGEPGPATVGAVASSSDSKWNAAELWLFRSSFRQVLRGRQNRHCGKGCLLPQCNSFFVERIHDLAAVKGEAIVRTNVNTCSRGSAPTWYTSELSKFGAERSSCRRQWSR